VVEYLEFLEVLAGLEVLVFLAGVDFLEVLEVLDKRGCVIMLSLMKTPPLS
jgi:hypothetical protein